MSQDSAIQLHCLPDCKPETGATIITRRKSGEAFTIIRKSVLNDASLSWQARGILGYLLGKPDGWKVRVADIVNHGPSGKAFVRAVLAELRATGYAKLDRIPGTRGRVAEWRWTVSDEPEFPPDTVRPLLANRYHSKKEGSKNDSKPSKSRRKPPTAKQRAAWKAWKDREAHDGLAPTDRDPALTTYAEIGLEGWEPGTIETAPRRP